MVETIEVMRKIYLDTCCVIYLIEEVPGFSEPTRLYLARNADSLLCLSPLVKMECLVKPMAEQSVTLIEDYELFIDKQIWLSVTDQDFTLATRLRATKRIKTPDALHLAIAINSSCDEFWTNDDRLSRVAGDIAKNILNVSP